MELNIEKLIGSQSKDLCIASKHPLGKTETKSTTSHFEILNRKIKYIDPSTQRRNSL